ncbi:MAG: amidohydrolase family protein [Fimbriimonadaceae bacterium]|nr:amidohydrolase family protein [Fimbriimonadaceae bacterium]
MKGVYSTWGPYGWGVYRVELGGGEAKFEPTGGVSEGVLAPGLVDVHIHGAFGTDFMSADLPSMVKLCDQLAGQGYDAFLPTTVTAPLDDVVAALGSLPDHPMVAGFHLEGPFISPKHPGAQPPESIVVSDPAWDKVLDDPRLRLVTLAPEQPGGLDLVRRLAARGVVVSLGHTDATFDQATEAARAGADHATHTFNAMRPFHHREPGTVGWVLQDDRAYAELIYDRTHVHPDAASLLLRAKPQDKVVGVSDSTMASGLPAGTPLTMWGHACEVGDKTVRLASNGALAGSAVTLLDVFQNLAADFGPETAVRCCSVNPRARLQLAAPPKRYLRFGPDLRLRDIHEC